ncbi:hypothetical protein ACFLU4_07850 [Chloroflexota bacterium]
MDKPDKATRNRLRWFERHLNWSVILVWLAWYAISALFGFWAWLIGIAVVVPLAAWALDKKKRSMWFLILFIVPFGLIIFLCIGNRSDITLRNKPLGGEAVEIFSFARGKNGYDYTLATRRDKKVKEKWVTWEDSNSDSYNEHYFQSYEDALVDFNSRITDTSTITESR